MRDDPAIQHRVLAAPPLAAAFLWCGAAASNEPLSDDDPFDPLGAPYCTTATDLNRTTAHWLQRSLDQLFSHERYNQDMRSIGIEPKPDLDQLRPLTNTHDAAVCERIRHALDLDWIGFRRDEERRLTVPAHYVVAYELPDGGYFAYLGYYDAGSPDGSIGPPDMSRAGGYHFDSNVVEIGRVGL